MKTPPSLDKTETPEEWDVLFRKWATHQIWGKSLRLQGDVAGNGPPQTKNRSTDRQNENISLKSTTIPVAGQKISWNDQYRKAVDPPEDPLMKSRGFCILQIPRFSILRYCSHFCLWLFYGPKTLFSSDIQVYSLIYGDHLFFHEDHVPRQFPFQNTIGIWKMLLLENDEIRIETCIFWEKNESWYGK